MDMENRFKLKIPNMLRSSFASCRSKNSNDVVEKPVFLPQNRQHYQLIDLFSPKTHPFPSISSPKCQENFQTEKINSKDNKNTLLVAAHFNGRRKCPPVSPISLLNAYPTFYQEYKTKPKAKRHAKKSTSKKTRSRTRSCQMYDFPECKYNGLFSSDEDEDKDEDKYKEYEDDDKTTFFSSRSFSSDSSGRNSAARKNRGSSQTRVVRKELEAGSRMPSKGKVKGSFAVVKSSSDPYDDFRTSMVEMIVERQIFGAQDLENMLQCFLSLNSLHHHRAIIEVFTEIWEALFSSWS